MSKFVNKEPKKKFHSELWEEKQDVSSNIKSIKRNEEFYPRNPLFIIIIYQLIYLSGIAYSLRKFFLVSQKWKNSLELSDRKSIFGSRQDQNDLEWKIFIPILLECAPYAFLHLFLAQFIKCYCPQVLRPFYITFSTVMMWKILGLFGTSLCYLIPIVMFVVLYSRARYLEKMMEDNGEREYTTSVIIAWIMLRCVSFCLITCDEDPERTKPDLPYLLDILSYSFYFPNFITGPYVPYKDYRAGVNEQFERWTLKKFVWFSLQIGKFLFYLFFADTLLYFFYAHSLQYNPRYIENFNPWTIAGYYSFILIFFFLKYVGFSENVYINEKLNLMS
ncbi:Protein-cysteine N-palmitoyltransferase HHAT [Armadillidium nasatum]|uniref:Protein-cysteine N-palmitoyltransferase HHAT n=1 Tax=Armadillidium nasatum TaxID=96803 RepID=A0A5N5SX59_9CRUS|nr:Protein-cysteine N-palmitoyltransferase HHAT [Armadillidium nasatum]